MQFEAKQRGKSLQLQMRVTVPRYVDRSNGPPLNRVDIERLQRQRERNRSGS